jgi:hypothetical protein
MSAVLAVVIPVAVYYFVVVQRQSEDQRNLAFRSLEEGQRHIDKKLEALGEVARNVANLYHVPRLTGTCKLPIEDLTTTFKEKDHGRRASLAKELKKACGCDATSCDGIEEWLAGNEEPTLEYGRINIPGIRPKLEFSTKGCKNDLLEIPFTDAHNLTASICGTPYAFTIETAGLLSGLQVTTEFTDVLLAKDDGTVIASVPGRLRSAIGTQDQLGHSLQPMSIAPILQSLGCASGTSSGAGLTKTKTDGNNNCNAYPGAPTVTSHPIGGTERLVYLAPIALKYQSQDPKYLYIAGIASRRALAPHSFTSFDVWLGSLSLIVALLAWPIIRLILLEPNDAVSQWEMRAAGFSVFMLAGILGIVAATLSLRGAANHHLASLAQQYAKKLESSVRHEVTRVLDVLKDIQKSSDGLELCSDEKYSHENGDTWKFDKFRHIDGNSRVWNGIYGSAWLDGEGITTNRATSSFDCSRLRPGVQLSDRKYFIRLKEGNGWSTGWSKKPFVAQRLFNRADGVTMLQVAVPLEDDTSPPAAHERPDFSGVVTADTPAVSLVEPLRVTPFGFSVIDNSSGMTILHDQDWRSLAEDFAEASDNSRALLTVQRARGDDHFCGRYNSEPHCFYAASIEGTPWTLVVRYPTESVDRLILYAGSTAVSIYLGVGVLVLVILMITHRATGASLSWVWPQWRLRHAYRPVAYFLGFFCLATYVPLLATRDSFLSVFILAILVPMAILGAGYGLLSTAPVRSLGRRLWLSAALASIAIWLALVALIDPGAMAWRSLMAAVGVVALFFLLGTLLVGRYRLNDEMKQDPAVHLGNPWWADSPLGNGARRGGEVRGRESDVDGASSMRYFKASLVLALIGLGFVPGFLLTTKAFDLQLQGRWLVAMHQVAEDFQSRRNWLENEFARLVADEGERRKYPSAFEIASQEWAPGYKLHRCEPYLCIELDLQFPWIKGETKGTPEGVEGPAARFGLVDFVWGRYFASLHEDQGLQWHLLSRDRSIVKKGGESWAIEANNRSLRIVFPRPPHAEELITDSLDTGSRFSPVLMIGASIAISIAALLGLAAFLSRRVLAVDLFGEAAAPRLLPRTDLATWNMISQRLEELGFSPHSEFFVSVESGLRTSADLVEWLGKQP